MKRRRTLSVLNRPFLLMSTLVNPNSCEMIELSGELDHQLLRQAIAAAIARHPSLNSRLVQTLAGADWIEQGAAEPIDLRIEYRNDANPETLRRCLIDNIWSEPLDLYHRRPARFHLTETAEGSILQLITSHIWSDARAGYRLAHDIATAYTALAEGREPLQDVIDVPNRASEKLLTSRLPRSAAHYWWAGIKLIMADLVSKVQGLSVPRSRGETDMRKFDLGPEFLQSLKQVAKTRGCTLHALILTALVRASQHHDRTQGRRTDRNYPLVDMFSLRPFASPAADDLYDNLVVPFGLRLDGRLDDSSLIRQAAAELQRFKEGDIFAELFRNRIYALTAMTSSQRASATTAARFIIKGNVIGSNPGLIPYAIDRFGPVPVTDFYSFAQLFPPHRIACTFSTFRGNLRLVAVFDSAAFPRGIQEEFVGPLLDSLSTLISPTTMEPSTTGSYVTDLPEPKPGMITAR